MEINPYSPMPAPMDIGRLPSAAREVKESTEKEAAESFATYLYAQMFSQMRPEPNEEEGGLFSGEQAGMFMDFFDQAIGKQYVHSGGSALVDQLVAQMTARTQPSKKDQP